MTGPTLARSRSAYYTLCPRSWHSEARHSSFFSPKQFVRNLVNFHKPRRELFTVRERERDSSSRDSPINSGHGEKRKEKKQQENGKQSWHWEQVYLRPWQWALRRRMASKEEWAEAGQKGSWQVDMAFPKPLFLLLQSLGDKGRGLFWSPDLWVLQSEDTAWEQFVQPLSRSIKDENFRPRSGSSPALFTQTEGFSGALYKDYHPFVHFLIQSLQVIL